jgi:hypothetical protein
LLPAHCPGSPPALAPELCCWKKKQAQPPVQKEQTAKPLIERNTLLLPLRQTGINFGKRFLPPSAPC